MYVYVFTYICMYLHGAFIFINTSQTKSIKYLHNITLY